MVAKTAVTLSGLYETDETAWLDVMADLIRAGRLSELDYPNLREHLEAMALRDRKKVESRLAILIAHVLKWTHQPEMRTQSWRNTIVEHRFKLNKTAAHVTLRKHAESVLAECYSEAVALAIEQTKLPAETFPEECPWTLEQLLSAEVLGE